MPKTKKRNRDGTLDITTATLPRLVALPAEVLRLHLSARSLETTGTKPVIAKRLHDVLHRPAPHFTGQESDSNILPSRTTPIQANEDMVECRKDPGSRAVWLLLDCGMSVDQVTAWCGIFFCIQQSFRYMLMTPCFNRL